MIQFIETIKKVAVNAVEAKKPVNILFGKVSSVSPLMVRLSADQIYSQEFLVTMDPTPTFQVGDILVLIRIQGGQKFLILAEMSKSRPK